MKSIKAIFENLFGLVETMMIFIGIILIILACTAFLWMPWLLFLLK